MFKLAAFGNSLIESCEVNIVDLFILIFWLDENPDLMHL